MNSHLQHFFARCLLTECIFSWHPTDVAARELSNPIFKISVGFPSAKLCYHPLPIIILIIRIRIGASTVVAQLMWTRIFNRSKVPTGFVRADETCQDVLSSRAFDRHHSTRLFLNQSSLTHVSKRVSKLFW